MVFSKVMPKIYILPNTAAIELVSTTLLTVPASAHACKTKVVPCTAGLMSSFSSAGFFNGNGLATWITWEQPSTALKDSKKHLVQ